MVLVIAVCAGRYTTSTLIMLDFRGDCLCMGRLLRVVSCLNTMSLCAAISPPAAAQSCSNISYRAYKFWSEKPVLVARLAEIRLSIQSRVWCTIYLCLINKFWLIFGNFIFYIDRIMNIAIIDYCHHLFHSICYKLHTDTEIHSIQQYSFQTV